jgi:hypothetical protein
MTLPETHTISRKKPTRLGSVNAARKGSLQDTYPSPILDGETPEENESSDKRYKEAVTLLKSLQPKAVVPYEPASEAADRNVRRIMYHCG